MGNIPHLVVPLTNAEDNTRCNGLRSRGILLGRLLLTVASGYLSSMATSPTEALDGLCQDI